jgi:hypothetical protein
LTLPLPLKTLGGLHLVGDHSFFFFLIPVITHLEDPKDLVCPNVLPLKPLDIGG